MKDIKHLITILKHHVDNATDVDDEGVEYYTDHTIAACDIKDIADMIEGVEKALVAKEEERIWEMYCTLIASQKVCGKAMFDMILREALMAVSVFNDMKIKEK